MCISRASESAELYSAWNVKHLKVRKRGLQHKVCYDFALFSRRDDGPTRFNRIGEDEGLK